MKLSNKIIIHPLTLFILFIGFLTGYVKYLFCIFSIVIIHELGHLCMSLIFKRKIVSLTILPFGGFTKVDALISTNIFEDLLIAVGGIFFQTVFGFILIILSHFSMIALDTYIFLKTYNIIIILFNLIPICPLDGYKIIKLLSELFIPLKKTFLPSIIISFLLFSLIFLYRYDLFRNNILIFGFLFFMSLEEIKNSKFILTRFYLERLNRDFDYPKKRIKKIDEMYKNKVHYIGHVHEKVFLKDLFTSKNA